MKNKILYNDEPMKFKVVKDFLPKLGLNHITDTQNSPSKLFYDKEGDALHVIFEEAKKSDKSALDKNDVIVTKRGKKVVNMTILNASRLFN